MKDNIIGVQFKNIIAFEIEREHILNLLEHDLMFMKTLTQNIKTAKFRKNNNLKNPRLDHICQYILDEVMPDMTIIHHRQKESTISLLYVLAEMIQKEGDNKCLSVFNKNVKQTGIDNDIFSLYIDNKKQIIAFKCHYQFKSEVFKYFQFLLDSRTNQSDPRLSEKDIIVNGHYSEEYSWKEKYNKTTILENVIDKRFGTKIKETKAM